MIRHFQKNSNKKNHLSLREKIIALVEKYPRYRHDLHNACVRDCHLSHSDFKQLLDEMERDGNIRINTNNLVQLPKPPETKTPPTEKETHTSKLPKPTLEILVNCLVNRSCTLKNPKQKKSLNYAHSNYTAEQIPLDRVCEETLLKGFHFVPGEFRQTSEIRTAENWNSQQLFLIEFDDTTENSLEEFIAARPFVQQNAWFATESLRSRYDDPNDPKCNGQLRARIVFCMPRPVKNCKERKWVYEALENALPGCDTGSANSIPNGGLGRLDAPHVKIGKIVDTRWFNAAIEAGKQDAAAKAAETARLKKERERKHAERVAMGFTEREGELPLKAVAKSDPSLFLEDQGLSLKSESGQYQRWGRPDKPNDTALTVSLSVQENYQITVFANSITIPPAASAGKSMPFTRFYCYHEFSIDIEGLQPDSQHWKDLNAELARRGYGTWLSDEEFRAKHATPTQTPDRRGLEPVTTLPPDHPLLTAAPPVEVRESPSFRHFSKEERAVVSDVLSLDPNAGWHGQIPIFTTRYEYLHPLTNKFALNGQPSEVEKRRVWSTLFGNCDGCGAVTARWVDRYLLTAGFYCDGCDKDYHLGSYLELELNRKLANSIVSEHQGFLGDDPAFADFRLWQPGTLTHLGAGMATGKSTEIYKQMTALAIQGLGKGIIAVPRVSLARFLAHYLRRRDGQQAWGLWHEGCEKSDKFIGKFGAIVCLPSLPNAIKSPTRAGVERIYIAIDEVDFSYNLLSLSVEQATAVKKCLRDALVSTGLVVSGQTESTLALEALTEELECEEVQGFYNTAKPADGHVLMHKYPNIEGKSNAMVCGTIDNIYDLLSEGHNVYSFNSTRRAADIIADEFQTENPVIYNGLTKGDPRADAVLYNQRLTDTHLFIGTSAAGVGISILDPKAQTVILNEYNYGSRHANESIQQSFRDRRRLGVSFHYTKYNLSLPVRPTENEEVSIYHEALKQDESQYAQLPTASIRKIARAQALESLADTQIEPYISHHLEKVGNMPVYYTSALACEPERVAVIAKRRSEIRQAERKNRITTAVELLNQRDILTSSGIRKLSNKGSLSTELQLAYKTANAVAQAVGWNEKTDLATDVLNNDDFRLAMRLAAENINTANLTKQRRGYMAVNFPKWTKHQFKSDLEQSDPQSVIDGLGIEITAIRDDRFLGEILSALMERLKRKVFDTASLANEVREVLASESSTGKTFGREIESGALGAAAYRKARFLHYIDDDGVVDWVRAFVSEWYPAHIAKNEDTFALTHAKNTDLRLASFSQWLMHQPSIPDSTLIDLDIFQPTALPDPKADRKAEARQQRKQGATLSEIADAFDIAPSTASDWCKGITPEKDTNDTRSVKEITESEGVSERTAYRRTAQQRAEANKEKDAELAKRIYELKSKGLSLRNIGTELDMSFYKVDRLLKEYKPREN